MDLSELKDVLGKEGIIFFPPTFFFFFFFSLLGFYLFPLLPTHARTLLSGLVVALDDKNL